MGDFLTEHASHAAAEESSPLLEAPTLRCDASASMREGSQDLHTDDSMEIRDWMKREH